MITWLFSLDYAAPNANYKQTATHRQPGAAAQTTDICGQFPP